MTADRGMLEEGDLIGGIELQERIGSGGFGIVYRGIDSRGARVAVKVLAVEVQHDADLAARLMKEATLMAEIEHDNVVRFHAAGKDGPRIWLAMELVPGGTLRDQLPRDVPIDVEQALRWARHIAEGCAEVHKIRDVTGRPVVHRDLKPENVLLSRDRIAKVADFGIAKFRTSLQSTLSNEGIGTPLYMAPEQMEASADIDERADVFALGVILYEMLSGRRPAEVGHDRELTLMEKVTRSILQPVVPLPDLNPQVPAHVWAIVERALQKKRENRFSSMREMADVLVESLKAVRRAHGKKPSFAELPRPVEVEAPETTGDFAGIGDSSISSVGAVSAIGVSAIDVSQPSGLGTATTDRAAVPAPRFGNHGTVRLADLEPNDNREPEAHSPRTSDSHLSTLAASSRSLKFPAPRGRMSLPVLIGGMVLGVGIGALAFRAWTSSAPVVQAAASVGPSSSTAAPPPGMLAVPLDAAVAAAEPLPPSTPDAGSPAAEPDAASAAAVAPTRAPTQKPVAKQVPTKQPPAQPVAKKAPTPTSSARPAPTKCASIACEPDL